MDSKIESSLDKKPGLTCSFCNVLFSTKSSLNRHKISCKNASLNSQGSIKPSGTYSNPDFSTHSKKSDLTCSFCNVTFCKKFNLNRHKLSCKKALHNSQGCIIPSEKSNNSDASTDLTCSFCNATFYKKFNVKRHEAICAKSQLNNQGCPKPEMDSNTDSTLRKKTNLSCPLCEVKYSTKFNLKTHIISCQNFSHPLQCSYSDCSLTFRLKKRLIEHIRTVHDNSVALPQKLKFSSLPEFLRWKEQEEQRTSSHYVETKGKYSIVYHCEVNLGTCISMIIVTVEKTEDTEHINATYFSTHSHHNAQGEMHFSSVHSEPVSKDFGCPNCNIKFTIKSSLKFHLKKCIKGKETIARKCSLCSSKFRFRSPLINHLKSVHKKNILPPVKKEFHNRQEFSDWKREEEERTYSYFTKQNCERKGRFVIFYCQRDGREKAHKTPGRKTGRTNKKGRIKTGETCLAMIKVKEKDDGHLYMEYYPSHCHELDIADVRHHPRHLSKVSSVKNVLAEVREERLEDILGTD